MATQLREYQLAAADALHKAYGKGLHRPGIQLPTGSGKLHPHSTLIQTPHGLMKFGELRVGDYVFGSDGEPTKITGVYEQGAVPVYRVTFSDHSSVLAGASHLWKVWRRRRAAKIMSTEQLMNTDLRDWEEGGAWRWRIPMCAPVQRPVAQLPVPPYTLGALIANGCLHVGHQPYVTTPDYEVITLIKAEHVSIQNNHKSVDHCPAYYILGVKQSLIELGLNVRSGRKFIPRMYLEASIDQRIALLRGLMDADGSSRSGGRRSILYHTTSAQLAHDVVELVQSLGGTANANFQNRLVKQNRSDDTIEWIVHILMPSSINPFGTMRKQNRESPRRMFEPHRAIVSIEPEGIENSRCIRVAADNSLYLIGRDYIVTHNTVIMSYIADLTMHNGGRVNTIVHRDALIGQTVKKLIDAGVRPDDIGIVKGRRNEIDKRCLVVSIHSLRSQERMNQLPIPNLTVIDEAHVSVSATYQRLYKHIGAYPGGPAYLAGFTATWMRSDRLGLGDIWEEIVFKRSIAWAVKKGFLVPPYPLQLGGELDLSNVRTTTAGDYNEADLEDVVMLDDLRDTVVRAYQQITPGASIALFGPTQRSTRFFLEALKEAGIPTAEVFASTKDKDRRWAFHGFESGAVKVLGSVAALAEGWDSPRCDGVFLLRPLKHLGLFIQMVGRALRPWVGKEQAMILDFVGALDDKDMNAAIDLSVTPELEEKEDKELEECDECGEWRILKYIKRVDQNLCADCVKKLEIEPEEREHTAKKIQGVYHIDLLGTVQSRWLQTEYGQPFVTTSDKGRSHVGRIYFIAPINGAFNVGYTGTLKTVTGGAWLAKGVTLADALEIGNQAVLDEDPTIAHKNSAWRKRPVSDGQVRYAQKFNIDVRGLKSGDAADLINIKIATRTLGPIYRQVYEAMMAMEVSA